MAVAKVWQRKQRHRSMLDQCDIDSQVDRSLSRVVMKATEFPSRSFNVLFQRLPCRASPLLATKDHICV